MNMKCLFSLAAAVAGSLLCADTLTWNPAEGSSVWDLTTPNWGEGVVWDATKDAVFGAEATAKTIALEGEVPVANISFSADGYVIGGTGRLVPTHNPNTIDVAKFLVDTWTVAPDCEASISNVSVEKGCTLVKEGQGALTFTGQVMFPRIHARDQGGRLNFVNAEVTANRIRASVPANRAEVLFDGVKLMPLVYPGEGLSDAHGLIGEGGNAFSKAYLGEGGLRYVTTNKTVAFEQGFDTAPGVAQDGGISQRGGVVLMTRPGTFNGGYHLELGQLRVKDSGALGTGDVTLETDTSLFAVGDVKLKNRIMVAGERVFVGATDDAANNLVLTRVGFAETAPRKVLGLGRVNGAYSRGTLALDSTGTDPFDQIAVRGAFNLTLDADLIKATPDARSPFFETSGLSPTNPAVAKVTRKGFTFDTNGADLELGLTLALPFGEVQTNDIVAAGAFANASFEKDANGWSFGCPSGSKYGNGGRYANSTGFTSGSVAHQTTNGTYYAVLRQLGWMSSAFTVPQDGDWSVVFDMGCRPEGSYAGHDIPVTLTVDGTDVCEIPAGRETRHPFQRFATPPIPLAAGQHTFKVTLGKVGENGGNTYDSLLFDTFRLARAEIVPLPGVVKRGAGELVITNLVTDRAVKIEGGALKLKGTELRGATVTVADGTRLSVASGLLTNTTVSVAAGGTLSFLSASNLFVDGDFEHDVITDARGFQTIDDGFATRGGWSFTRLSGQGYTSGVQKNGGAMSKVSETDVGPYTTSGEQTVFLRTLTQMSASVSVAVPGRYRLTFLQSARHYGESYTLPLSVKIDDEEVFTLAPRTKNYEFTRETVDVELAAGTHTVTFEVGSHSNKSTALLLDDIGLQPLMLEQTIVDTAVNLATGSTLDLQNAQKLVLAGGVFVDGVKFTGNRNQLAAKGVVVTGDGDLQVGPPGGTVLIMR